MRRLVPLLIVMLALGVVAGVGTPAAGASTPRADCGPGSKPETDVQGRVPTSDYSSGRTKDGYLCNLEIVSHYGSTGGYRVHRYVDAAGHECAYYDTTLLFPVHAAVVGPDLTGTYVLDMANPSKPVRTAALTTPAMMTPHESLSINSTRGLLGAVMGNPITYPGIIDLYDISGDCRSPVLKASLPFGTLGHEGGFAPDGNTYYATSTQSTSFTAIDVSSPSTPAPVWTSTAYRVHGLNVSDDGNRLYIADLGNPGVTIIDVSQIQQRVPNPTVREVSHITWDNVSIPQTAIPVTIAGHPYLVEIDEFARGVSTDPAAPVGAARIIDIADETHPIVVSNIRLAVNEPSARLGAQASDPGVFSPLQGYAGHYCGVPDRHEPGIVACSFIESGLRVFDIRDVLHPREIAYFNPPSKLTAYGDTETYYAMSAPTFVPSRGEVWYSDGNYGFYALRFTNGVWPFSPSGGVSQAGDVRPAVSAANRSSVAGRRTGTLPSTGGSAPVGTDVTALFVVAGLVTLRLSRRR